MFVWAMSSGRETEGILQLCFGSAWVRDTKVKEDGR